MDSLSFILNQLGEDSAAYYRAVSPPIVQTSNFEFETVDALRESFKDEYSTHLYSRGRNPTVDILAEKLAALDGAEMALVFNSGAAAITATVMGVVQSGDHIIAVKQPYTWAKHVFTKLLPKYGVTTTFIDGETIDAYEKALQPNTKLIYLESPNSWTYAIQPLAAIATLAKARGIITLIDNSYCTPIYQRPLDFGIDLSLQSATKYIGGHSDTLGGVVCGSKALLKPIFDSEYLCIGSGIQPFNAWLLLRGLRTLPVRLQQVAANTRAVYEWLSAHPKIDQVWWPFAPNSPQLALAQSQMKEAPGLISFAIRTDSAAAIETFANNLRHIRMAVSWGGYESLLIPKVATLQPGQFQAAQALHRSCRLYVGLETPTHIISDLEQALQWIP